MPSAMASRTCALGCPGSNGMSATKAPTAARRSGVAYGAAKAAATSRGIERPLSAEVPRTKMGVWTVLRRSSGDDRASRMIDGDGEPSGWWTAVFSRTIPRSCSRWASAQPREIGPPQSCATVTTGPSMPSAAEAPPRSATRSPSRWTVCVRSE